MHPANFQSARPSSSAECHLSGVDLKEYIRPTQHQTFASLVSADLIDTDEPEKSLLLMKPTLQVKHVGGQKMIVGDRSYKQFWKFIEDYAATSAGKYKTADELPRMDAEASRVSDVWFKLTVVPESFDQQLLQVDLYRRDDQTKAGWSVDRWATADRQVFGKGRLWQHSLRLSNFWRVLSGRFVSQCEVMKLRQVQLKNFTLPQQPHRRVTQHNGEIFARTPGWLFSNKADFR